MEDKQKEIDRFLNSTDGPEKLSFEEGIKLLERLVQSVEAGALPLEKAVTSYEKGVRLVQHLRSQLSGAEQKLKVLQKAGAVE
jgi:exodeoxyribonuclease VII small subunit